MARGIRLTKGYTVQEHSSREHDHRAEPAGESLVTWWLARGEQVLPPPGEWLTALERNRADRLRFTKRRTDYLLSRWTLKLAVARVLGWPDDVTALARIESRAAASGAPRLYVDGRSAAWRVSISDRAGCAVCLVAAGSTPVGCDVEVVEPRSEAFAADYFTDAERRTVAEAGPAADVIVNLIWSAKESALKVLGTGLRRDTRSVEVSVADLNPPLRLWSRLEVRTSEGDCFAGWWRRGGAFLVTACWSGSGPPPAALEPQSPIDALAPSHRWLGRPVT